MLPEIAFIVVIIALAMPGLIVMTFEARLNRAASKQDSQGSAGHRESGLQDRAIVAAPRVPS